MFACNVSAIFQEFSHVIMIQRQKNEKKNNSNICENYKVCAAPRSQTEITEFDCYNDVVNKSGK